MPANKPLLVFTTVAKKSDAVRISKTLVEKKLAACVTTLSPGESRYTWNGKVCVEKEFVLLIKTIEKNFKKIEQSFKTIHPYECPELIGFEIERISKKYRDWLITNFHSKP